MATIPFSLRQLEYFTAAASEGSLSAAAQRCNVSASALALALDELEAHLALQLFIRRRSRGVTLTPAGSRLLAHAQRILSGAEALTADAWQASARLDGRFALGCFRTLAPFVLPGILQRFTGRHPEIRLEISEGAAPDLERKLLLGRLDAALLYSIDISEQLTFDAVSHHRPYAMLAADHRLAGRDRIALGELVAEPLIVLDVHPSRINTEQIFSALSLQPRIGHTTTSFELVRCLVARGLGYAVAFQRPAAGTTYDGRELRIIELDGDVPESIVGLARPAGSPRTARHDALLAYFGAADALK